MPFNPSSYQVRLTSVTNGKFGSAATFENKDAEASAKIKLAACNIAKEVLNGRVKLQEFHEVEILRGETLNNLSRLEALLQRCRNLLTDLDGASMSPELRSIYDAVMDDLDEANLVLPRES